MRLPPLRFRPSLHWLAIALCLGYLACALLDRPLFHLIGHPGSSRGDWGQLFRLAGFLPTWIAVALTFLLIDAGAAGFRSARAWARAAPLLISAAGAGLIAEILKRLIGRERPTHHDGLYVYKPFLRGFIDDSNLGLPSSHAAVAFGAAFLLARLYPRAWPVFIALAVGCAAGRLVEGAHFLTDVYLAAVVGLAASALWRRPAQSGAG